MVENFNSSVSGVASATSTMFVNNQQWSKYHGMQGHGFAAEDANALRDKWHGKSMDKVGMDNAINGADRVANGVEIQTKYCSDASKSLDAAFDNRSYHYSGMKFEVPCDQYDVLVRIFQTQ